MVRCSRSFIVGRPSSPRLRAGLVRDGATNSSNAGAVKMGAPGHSHAFPLIGAHP
jgi:hypothetical protein